LINDPGNPIFDYVDADVVATNMEEHSARMADRSPDLWFVLVLDAFLTNGPQTRQQTRP